jgi:epoxyqueuosine reductase
MDALRRLVNLLWLTEDQFRVRYGQSAIARIGRERLVRNACVAAGNSGDPEFAHILDHLARHDTSELVREHAAWGLGRLRTP